MVSASHNIKHALYIGKCDPQMFDRGGSSTLRRGVGDSKEDQA